MSGVGGQHRIELLEEEEREIERERTTPIAAFDCGFLTQENADTFPILICRVKRERRVVNGKVPQHSPFHFLSVSSRILVFAESALQDAVSQACAGVEVIPKGPPVGDHMANGRVEMAVREVKRQCRTLRISAEHSTSVRIADDSPSLSWLLRHAAQIVNNVRIGKDGKTSELRRTGRRWRKPMAQFGEKVGVSSFASRMTQGNFVGHIMIEQEQFCALPRTELCEAKVGQDRHGAMLGNPRTGTACKAFHVKWWHRN